jgi:stage III sporulation protein SpoIIIAA
LFQKELEGVETPQEESPHPVAQKVIVDDLGALMEVLPGPVQEWVKGLNASQDLLEVVLDLGRLPQARFRDREELLAGREVTDGDLESVIAHLGPFGDDNRAGIERTLHRISCLRNRSDRIVGLTCRVGRAVYGTIRIMEDLVRSGKSVLLLGRPGVGKTTMLREVARVLADDVGQRVIVVDTSNEIAGDGDIPHAAIGSARRMQVKTPTLQHGVMIEAVENHMPQVIIIDEMGTELEAVAARTIAERGVQLIATAHGNTLENLILNPTLSDLVGGIQTVTLGDEEARRRRTQKSVLERKAPPTFEVLVEIQAWDRVAVHLDVAKTVDALLRGQPVRPEVRWMDQSGTLHKEQGEPILLPTPQFSDQEEGPSFPARRPWGPRRTTASAAGDAGEPEARPAQVNTYRLLPFGVSKDRLLQTVRQFGLGVELAPNVQDADMVLTTKVNYRKRSDVLRAAEEQGKPIYVLRRNTQVQLEQFLKSLSAGWGGDRGVNTRSALEEAEEAVNDIMGGEESVELSPQSAYIRRLQHVLAERYNLRSASTGRDPQRRVIIFNPQGQG